MGGVGGVETSCSGMDAAWNQQKYMYQWLCDYTYLRAGPHWRPMVLFCPFMARTPACRIDDCFCFWYVPDLGGNLVEREALQDARHMDSVNIQNFIPFHSTIAKRNSSLNSS